MIKFSILIPNYGNGPFLKESILAAISQTKTGEFDFEIIFFDQSEFDDHMKIIEMIKNCDLENKVKIYRSDVKSILNARIELIKHASGDYIVFLDSDDYLSINYLSKLIKILKTKNFPDVIIQNLIMVDDKKNVLKYQLPVPSDIEGNLLDYFYYSNYLNSIVRKIFRRELFCEKETPQISITNGDDWVVSLSIMKRAKEICFLNDSIGYYYRQNGNSSTHEFDYETAVSAIYFKDSIINIKMNEFQKTLYFKQKIYDFFNCFRSLVKNKRIGFRSFISDAKKFRKNLLKLGLLHSAKGLPKKHVFVFKLIKYRLFLILFIIFKF